MYAVGWAKKGNSGAGHACAIPALLLGGRGGERAPAFAATADEKDKVAVPKPASAGCAAPVDPAGVAPPCRPAGCGPSER